MSACSVVTTISGPTMSAPSSGALYSTTNADAPPTSAILDTPTNATASVPLFPRLWSLHQHTTQVRLGLADNTKHILILSAMAPSEACPWSAWMTKRPHVVLHHVCLSSAGGQLSSWGVDQEHKAAGPTRLGSTKWTAPAGLPGAVAALQRYLPAAGRDTGLVDAVFCLAPTPIGGTRALSTCAALRQILAPAHLLVTIDWHEGWLLDQQQQQQQRVHPGQSGGGSKFRYTYHKPSQQWYAKHPLAHHVHRLRPQQARPAPDGRGWRWIKRLTWTQLLATWERPSPDLLPPAWHKGLVVSVALRTPS